MDRFRPQAFLPLTPVAFEILLALAEGEQHGYSIMREVDRRSNGAVTLHPGTLYRALARLLESGLIAELDERPDPQHDDERLHVVEHRPGVRALDRKHSGGFHPYIRMIGYSTMDVKRPYPCTP